MQGTYLNVAEDATAAIDRTAATDDTACSQSDVSPRTHPLYSPNSRPRRDNNVTVTRPARAHLAKLRAAPSRPENDGACPFRLRTAPSYPDNMMGRAHNKWIGTADTFQFHCGNCGLLEYLLKYVVGTYIGRWASMLYCTILLRFQLSLVRTYVVFFKWMRLFLHNLVCIPTYVNMRGGMRK